jgi:hypothetical protein
MSEGRTTRPSEKQICRVNDFRYVRASNTFDRS